MPIPFSFDFKRPNYIKAFEYRLEKLEKIRKNPQQLTDLKLYYQNNIAQFIIDWGCTSDPRHVEIGLPATIPFLLFPKQEEWVNWFIDSWKNRKNGLSEKSREVGMTWMACAVSASVCLLNNDVVVGIGSRKSEYVDKLGDPKCIFHKIRQFVSLLPSEFKGNWDERDNRCSKQMILNFPGTGSTISGEAGDGIGRGARTSFYLVDESAFLERPQLVDMSLSQTTNCRIDISTPCGVSNSFAQKRRTYSFDRVFTIRWQDDPRKDQEWYETQKEKLNDPIVIAQELDLDYNASVEGVLIPTSWVIASIDAHEKLNIIPTGVRLLGFDVADEGRDKNAICGRYGVLIEYLDEWSGKNSDIYKSTEKVIDICDIMDYPEFYYDADGLGASVRGDAVKINSMRVNKIIAKSFRGSGSVTDPTGDPFQSNSEQRMPQKGRTNEDYFANRKAQGWFSLRQRFYKTYRAIEEKADIHPDEIISISSKLGKYRDSLIVELSQPTFLRNTAGKILIDKTPEGCLSPNKADAVMIAFAPTTRKSGGFFSGKKVN